MTLKFKRCSECSSDLECLDKRDEAVRNHFATMAIQQLADTLIQNSMFRINH